MAETVEAAELTFERIAVGDTAEFAHRVTPGMVQSFAAFSGDFNPLHTSPEYAATTAFGRPIAHGMVAGALISRLLGMHLPGRYCLYLSQTVSFHKPIYVDTVVAVRGRVLRKVDSQQVITVDTTLSDAGSGDLLVSGTALVKVLK